MASSTVTAKTFPAGFTSTTVLQDELQQQTPPPPLFKRVGDSNLFVINHSSTQPNTPPLILERVSHLSPKVLSAAPSENEKDNEEELFSPNVMAFQRVVRTISELMVKCRAINGWTDSLSKNLWDWGSSVQNEVLRVLECSYSTGTPINEQDFELFKRRAIDEVISILKNPYGGEGDFYQDPVLDGEEPMERTTHRLLYQICRGEFPGTERPMTIEPIPHTFASEVIALVRREKWHELPASNSQVPIQDFLNTLPHIEEEEMASSSASTHQKERTYSLLIYENLTKEQSETLRTIELRFQRKATKILSEKQFKEESTLQLEAIHNKASELNSFLECAAKEMKLLSQEATEEATLSKERLQATIEARIESVHRIHQSANRALNDRLTETEARFKAEMEQKQQQITAQHQNHVAQLGQVQGQVDKLALAQANAIAALQQQTLQQVETLRATHFAAIQRLDRRIADQAVDFRNEIDRTKREHNRQITAMSAQASSLTSQIGSLHSQLSSYSHTVNRQEQELSGFRVRVNQLQQQNAAATANAHAAIQQGTHRGGFINNPIKAISGFFRW